ncbi:MAG: hypothetical protein D6729_04885 [Deltaproteobacteria bacterium]|nr:MAG: hypothetical protein D6729_04885 [Deltaproteobacteria bacterium]
MSQVDAILQRAIAAYAEGRSSAARQALIEALQVDPANRQARNLAARLFPDLEVPVAAKPGGNAAPAANLPGPGAQGPELPPRDAPRRGVPAAASTPDPRADAPGSEGPAASAGNQDRGAVPLPAGHNAGGRDPGAVPLPAGSGSAVPRSPGAVHSGDGTFSQDPKVGAVPALTDPAAGASTEGPSPWIDEGGLSSSEAARGAPEAAATALRAAPTDPWDAASSAPPPARDPWPSLSGENAGSESPVAAQAADAWGAPTWMVEPAPVTAAGAAAEAPAPAPGLDLLARTEPEVAVAPAAPPAGDAATSPSGSAEGEADAAPSAPGEDAARSEEIESLLQGARDLFELADFSGSLELIEKVLELDPENAEAREYLRRNEDTLVKMYESKLGSLDHCPRVRISPDEIVWLNLDHRAGFVLAQIDGEVSYEEIYALSGMSRLDTSRILAQLVEEQVIE